MNLIKFKSIKQQMLISIVLLIVVICGGLAVLSINFSKQSLIKTIDTTLPEIADESASKVEQALNEELRVLDLVSTNPILSDEKVTLDQKLQVLKNEQIRSKHKDMTFIDTNGNAVNLSGKTFSVKNQDTFKKAMQGEGNVTNPIVSENDGTIIVLFSTPIKKGDKVVGVINAVRNGDELANYTKSISLGTTGKAYILNSEGTLIADNNRELVLSQNNNIKNLEKDSSLDGIVQIEKKMIASQKGTGTYKSNGKEIYVGYSPIKVAGWSLAISVESNEILSEVGVLTTSIVIVSLIFLAVGAIVAYFVSASISTPIKSSVNQLEAISSGDLTTDVPDNLLARKDEIGTMGKSINIMKESIISMLNDIKLGSSNINEQTETLYAISKELMSSSDDINVATNDVANGNTQQAGDLVDISGIVDTFGSNLDDVVGLINDVEKGSVDIQTMANNSTNDMDNVASSVKNLNESFKDLILKSQNVEVNVKRINEITTLIGGIAEQTNLLALNAAIESARAGEAGRGFSVVADEIKKLAEQSKESSYSISNIVSEISNETKLMVETTETVNEEMTTQEGSIHTAIESFQLITDAVNNIIPKMQSANESTKSLHSSKDYILEKVESTSAVAEEISASSEEIAASTGEMGMATKSIAGSLDQLTGMSQRLMENVNKFKID